MSCAFFRDIPQPSAHIPGRSMSAGRQTTDGHYHRTAETRGQEEVVTGATNSGADFHLRKGGAPKSQFAGPVHKIRHAIPRFYYPSYQNYTTWYWILCTVFSMSMTTPSSSE